MNYNIKYVYKHFIIKLYDATKCLLNVIEYAYVAKSYSLNVIVFLIVFIC